MEYVKAWPILPCILLIVCVISNRAPVSADHRPPPLHTEQGLDERLWKFREYYAGKVSPAAMKLSTKEY